MSLSNFRNLLSIKISIVDIATFLSISALTLFTPPASNAAVVVTANEVGGDVVFSGGGSLNLSDLSIVPDLFGNPVLFCGVNGALWPSRGIYNGGGTGFCTNSFLYVGASFVGPSSFGPGPGQINVASQTTGDFAAIYRVFQGGILAPASYTSGSSFFGTSTYLSETFSSLDLTPGTYDWVWGTANPDSYRLIIGNSTGNISNVPGPLPLFGVAAAFGWSRRLRSRLRRSTPTV